MSTRPSAGFEIFAVTADQGIHAWGPTLSDLFREAARGLFSLMVAVEGVVCREWIPVTVTGGDRETLLVAWLNELLYLYEARGVVAGEFRIERVGATTLSALVGAEPADVSRHVLLGHVKAATYHGLSVCRAGDGWEARVVVDV